MRIWKYKKNVYVHKNKNGSQMITVLMQCAICMKVNCHKKK